MGGCLEAPLEDSLGEHVGRHGSLQLFAELGDLLLPVVLGVGVFEGQIVSGEHVVLKVDGDQSRLQYGLKLLRHILPVLTGHHLLLLLLLVVVPLLLLLLLLVRLLLHLVLMHLLLLHLMLLLLLSYEGLLLLLLMDGGLLPHVLLEGHLFLLVYLLLLLDDGRMVLGLHLLLLLGLLDLGLGRVDHDLVVLVTVLVAHLFLVIGAAPLAVHDVLILVGAGCECLSCQPVFENVTARVHPLHLHPLLPVAERADYEHLVAALAPGENMLRRGWWRRHWRLRRGHNLLLLILLGHDHLLLLLMSGYLLLLLMLRGRVEHVLLLLVSCSLLLSATCSWEEALGPGLVPPGCPSEGHEGAAIVGGVLLGVGHA